MQSDIFADVNRRIYDNIEVIVRESNLLDNPGSCSFLASDKSCWCTASRELALYMNRILVVGASQPCTCSQSTPIMQRCFRSGCSFTSREG